MAHLGLIQAWRDTRSRQLIRRWLLEARTAAFDDIEGPITEEHEVVRMLELSLFEASLVRNDQ